MFNIFKKKCAFCNMSVNKEKAVQQSEKYFCCENCFTKWQKENEEPEKKGGGCCCG